MTNIDFADDEETTYFVGKVKKILKNITYEIILYKRNRTATATQRLKVVCDI